MEGGESPRLHLIGEMNNTFEASHKLRLIRLKLQPLTYFSLSSAREGWELSTFSFLLNLCPLHKEKNRGLGERGRLGRRMMIHPSWDNVRSLSTMICSKSLGTSRIGRNEKGRAMFQGGAVCCVLGLFGSLLAERYELQKLVPEGPCSSVPGEG